LPSQDLGPREVEPPSTQRLGLIEVETEEIAAIVGYAVILTAVEAAELNHALDRAAMHVRCCAMR
jgi:hypothetical protein